MRRVAAAMTLCSLLLALFASAVCLSNFALSRDVQAAETALAECEAGRHIADLKWFAAVDSVIEMEVMLGSGDRHNYFVRWTVEGVEIISHGPVSFEQYRSLVEPTP